MEIAVLMCVYAGDSIENFRQSLKSIYGANVDHDCTLNVYLHIDGVVPKEYEEVLSDFSLFRIVRSEDNVGLAKGLNKLIGCLADEKYIFRMDADDVVIKDRFKKQIAFMESHPEVDFCGGGIQEFVGDGEVVNIRWYPEEHNEIVKYLPKGSPFAHVTICFRQGFFESFGSYPVNYALNEDIAYWFQVIKQGARGANLKKELVLVRMDSAYSRRTFKKALGEFKVYKEINLYYEKSLWLPIARFAFRLLPSSMVKFVYNSSLRDLVLKK